MSMTDERRMEKADTQPAVFVVDDGRVDAQGARQPAAIDRPAGRDLREGTSSKSSCRALRAA